MAWNKKTLEMTMLRHVIIIGSSSFRIVFCTIFESACTPPSMEEEIVNENSVDAYIVIT